VSRKFWILAKKNSIDSTWGVIAAGTRWISRNLRVQPGDLSAQKQRTRMTDFFTRRLN
jgi:hypothetical protein